MAVTSAMRTPLLERVTRHLQTIVNIGARPPGSPANHRATGYVLDVVESAGLTPRLDGFHTRWWEPGEATLVLDGTEIHVTPNPYSAPTTVSAPVAILSADAPHIAPYSIVVVDQEMAPDAIMPKAFPFFTSPDHAALIARLEALRPAAVVTVSQGPPILEDPDLPFPSVTVSPDVGVRLARSASAGLRISGTVHAGSGETVSAAIGRAGPGLVISAHLDSKSTTPGAFDNAGSVAVLLAWIEAGRLPSVPLEVVFFNGEDHFDACGEQAWLAATDLSQVRANINLDGVGVIGRTTTVAALEGPESLDSALATFVEEHHGWERTDPWFESDHAIFALRGIPALAVTSANVHDLLRDVAHTPRDTIDLVDPTILARVATDLDALVRVVDGNVR